MLYRANDWQFSVDLPDFPYKFPEFIAVTTQRPDILIYSYTKRIAILIELTVPWEENARAAAVRKEDRYAKLVEEISGAWQTHYWTIEIGSRGLCSQSLTKCFRELGIGKPATSKLRRVVVDTAQRCSFIIYSSRNRKDWTTPVLKPCASKEAAQAGPKAE